MSRTGVGPLTWLGDRLLPALIRQRRIARDACRYADLLLSTNAMRVESDLRERVRASRRWLERQVRVALTDGAATAQRALEEAQRQRSQGSAAVQRRLQDLGTLRLELERCMADDAR
jgi:hypothetical protein